MSTSTLTKNQTKTFRADYFTGDPAKPEPETLVATVRYDDQCGNGHNTFSITADIYGPRGSARDGSIEHQNGRRLYWIGGGCQHDEIAARLPELAPYIKWHLCSSDGPLHYPANALHFASDRDCWGKGPGDVATYSYGVRFADSPVTHTLKDGFYKWLRGWPWFQADKCGPAPADIPFRVVAIAHGPSEGGHEFGDKYTLASDHNRYGSKWHECPFDSQVEAEEFALALNTCKVEFVKLPVAYSKGKARELDHARSAAVWPEATDDELMAPDLKQRLEDRLPQLMADFRAAVESLGFTW